ncbi:MAG: hypothetical protein AB7S26_17635 [Sandaracinaceae bacterium]
MSARLAPLIGIALLVGCGPIGAPGETGPIQVAGRITYDARHPTVRGTSAAVEVRPARFVDLEVLDGSGAVVAEGRADADGRFDLRAPAEGRSLRVLARVRVNGHDLAISEDEVGRVTHAMDVALTDGPLDVHAVDPTGDAGAFHVVDTLLRGVDAVHDWTGRTLPPVFVYWVRGGTREWSFYRGERPAGSGRYALELLGGDPGQASVSDTDEHDEAIILHELGHFVMDRLTSDSSTGGMHPRGARIDPGVAWEEGRASWFALAVLRAPLYQDTIGVEPWGTMRVDEDLEGGEDPVAGIASETSVSKILWDLSDGAEALPDQDDDGVALGPAPILRAMVDHAAEPGVFASLPSFLAHLLARGVVAPDALAHMLERGGEPAGELVHAPSEVPWPRRLTLGEMTHGTIDGLTQPAPSGGLNLPITGFDANHTYLVRVEHPGMLVANLTIEGTGRVEDRSDLTLELRDLRATILESSTGQSSRETLAHMVTEPAYFIVKVRDGGLGNRAAYRLEVALETL